MSLASESEISVKQHRQPSERVDSSANLWTSFANARNEKDFYLYWLTLQSQTITDAICSLLVINKEENSLEPVAGWPKEVEDFSHLSGVVELALEERCGQLEELKSDNRYGVAYPLLVDGSLYGIVALEVKALSEQDLQAAMEKLQWGIGWLELLERRRQVENDRDLLARLKQSVDLLAVTLNQDEFRAAATVFTTELAMVSGCERVSFGLFIKNKTKLQAVSYSADVEQKMSLTRSLEDSMDEAILQRQEILHHTGNDEVLINRAHDALSRQQAMASLATFPLFLNQQYYGALTCERAADKPFTQKDAEFFRAVTSLAGPALYSKYKNDRPLFVKIWIAVKKQLYKLIGKEHVAGKVVFFLLVLLALCFNFMKGDYRLSADIVLEGAVRRAVVTPFDGFIDEAMVRAGDLVEKGDILCLLDDRDLRLMSLAKQSDFSQLQRQYQESVAKYDRAQTKIIRAQLDHAQAEIDLVEAKLARTRLIAPFQGLLVSGDLSQRLGGAVKQGEVLFEITPLEKYRVILKVDERRIGDVQKEQQGVLVLGAQPDNKYRFTVTRVTPIAKAEEGRNYFRVEAVLDASVASLRPGLEGVGKIDVDRRRLVTIWTRDMVEWFKLYLWRWFS